ncbi:MAG: DNA polymerase IV [Chloroflexi bacterium]|nr:DNA polymerase IV [Chloroflexota bacterium]MBU1662318.1 DNA polymerase IV [Chloroflexota bacterium]
MNNKTRQIIHLDLDAFYCAVEEQRDPSLCGLPFAVGGRPEGRGVVASCSYTARAYGVRSAMPMSRAVRLCPKLLVVSSHFSDYHEASRKVMKRLRDLTPLVEQISIDEAFLDVTDLPGPVEAVARRLQEVIRHELGLPCSLGIATNKLVAKTATDVGKMAVKGGNSPNAMTIVPPGEEAEFLAQLPVEMLWGVGPKSAEKLALMNVRTIGELAAISDTQLAKRFGKIGWDLAKRAKGIDTRPIVTERETKSISQEVTYAKDECDETKLRQTLQKQSQNIGSQLRNQNLTARTVKIKLRWPDFKTLTRQTTLDQPTDDGEVIGKTALKLFEDNWKRGHAVRLLGVGVSGLDTPPKQIGLWDRDWVKEEQVQHTLVELRKRFGDDALGRGMPKRKASDK